MDCILYRVVDNNKEVEMKQDCMELTGEEMQSAVNTQRLKCRCGAEMRYLQSSFKRDEFYCSACHTSAPLFDRMR